MLSKLVLFVFVCSVRSRDIGWEGRLRIYLFCVEWDIKPGLISVCNVMCDCWCSVRPISRTGQMNRASSIVESLTSHWSWRLMDMLLISGSTMIILQRPSRWRSAAASFGLSVSALALLVGRCLHMATTIPKPPHLFSPGISPGVAAPLLNPYMYLAIRPVQASSSQQPMGLADYLSVNKSIWLISRAVSWYWLTYVFLKRGR